jgi:hypothetical protein
MKPIQPLTRFDKITNIWLQNGKTLFIRFRYFRETNTGRAAGAIYKLLQGCFMQKLKIDNI